MRKPSGARLTSDAALLLSPGVALLVCHDCDSSVVLAEAGLSPTLASSWPHSGPLLLPPRRSRLELRPLSAPFHVLGHSGPRPWRRQHRPAAARRCLCACTTTRPRRQPRIRRGAGLGRQSGRSPLVAKPSTECLQPSCKHLGRGEAWCDVEVSPALDGTSGRPRRSRVAALPLNEP
jgi:hypothetical protein